MFVRPVLLLAMLPGFALWSASHAQMLQPGNRLSDRDSIGPPHAPNQNRFYQQLRQTLPSGNSLPQATGLAAAAHMLLAFQPLNIAAACRRIAAGVGSPLRTSKVTV